MIILGLSSGHDANMCVLQDGQLLLHVEKERLTRRRYDGGSMEDVVTALCHEVSIALSDIDLVATSIPVWPHLPRTGAFVGPDYDDEFGWVEGEIQLAGTTLPAVQIAHHLSHAAYAFYTSPCEAADILTLDAGGNFTCGMFSRGTPAGIQLVAHLEEQTLGIAWCALALRLFGNIFAAGKVMGLAPYGQPRFRDDIWREYGGRDTFGCRIISMPFPDLEQLPSFPGLSSPHRSARLTQADRDAAASLQTVTNEMVLELLSAHTTSEPSASLCFGGGVALNCVLNEAIRTSGLYDRVHVGPAPADGGLAVGCALYATHAILGRARNPIEFFSPFSGRTCPSAAVETAVDHAHASGMRVHRCGSHERRDQRVADLLARGHIVGIHQGRAESGPRALGHRSILADPRDPAVRDRINHSIKYREAFRPFAPAIMEDHLRDVVDSRVHSPYMSFAPQVTASARPQLAAGTHVDGSARLQTVSRDAIPEFWGILRQFYLRTGVPGLINTSLNTRGQPICDTPGDSVSVLTTTDLDALALEEFVICKPGKTR